MFSFKHPVPVRQNTANQKIYRYLAVFGPAAETPARSVLRRGSNPKKPSPSYILGRLLVYSSVVYNRTGTTSAIRNRYRNHQCYPEPVPEPPVLSGTGTRLCHRNRYQSLYNDSTTLISHSPSLEKYIESLQVIGHSFKYYHIYYKPNKNE